MVCDDEDVAAWAREQGAAVVWTPGTGLNGAVAGAVDRVRDAGVARVVVAHADLPFATGLAELAVAEPDEVVLVPDRRRDGTNVLSVPTDAGFVFAYGAGSFGRHLAETERIGRRARVVTSEQLGWDVDDPERPGGAGAPGDAAGGGSTMTALDRPPASVDLEVPASALVIVAHPDDAEFQCGATLAKWARAGAWSTTWC